MPDPTPDPEEPIVSKPPWPPQDKSPASATWPPEATSTKLISESGVVELDLPPGLSTESLDILPTPLRQGYGSSQGIRRAFELTATAPGRDDAAVHQFDAPLTIKINLIGRATAGLDMSTARIIYWEETGDVSADAEPGTRVSGHWEGLESVWDSEANTITASTDHFSIFGWLANPAYAIQSAPYSFQVGLNQGTANFSYPIQLPPSRGNYQPNLTLSYSSAVVNEMKNQRDVGSWVGIGFSLDTPYMFYNEEKAEWNLVLGGISGPTYNQ
jgi:hypothetical protein